MKWHIDINHHRCAVYWVTAKDIQRFYVGADWGLPRWLVELIAMADLMDEGRCNGLEFRKNKFTDADTGKDTVIYRVWKG